MTVLTSERSKRQLRRPRPVTITPAPATAPVPPVVTAFRRPDDTLCHGRCGKPLSFQGVRGLIEADFYCLVGLVHVAIPLGVGQVIPAGHDFSLVVRINR